MYICSVLCVIGYSTTERQYDSYAWASCLLCQWCGAVYWQMEYGTVSVAQQTIFPFRCLLALALYSTKSCGVADMRTGLPVLCTS